MRHLPVPLLLAPLLVAVLLAACLSPAPEDEGADARLDVGYDYEALDEHGLPVPRLLCHPLLPGEAAALHAAAPDGMRCNFEMTPAEGRTGNEVTIAVNPLDPRNVVGGAKDYYPPDAGECVWDGVYVTHDGAATAYEDRSFDGSPWRLRAGDTAGFRPNYLSQFWCTTDPVAYFDDDGRLYYLLMAYQADPVTGSKACEEECPQGAFNDWAFNRAAQVVAVSDDGGRSFHTVTPVLEGSYPVNFHDKGWLAVSPDGTVHVMWLAFFVPGNQYCRSTDGAQTFLCTHVPGVQFLDAGQGSFVEVGPGSEVYLAWHAGGIRLQRSLDGGATWEDEGVVQETNEAAMPGLSPRDRRGGFPHLATDRNPDSPFAGALHFVWQDACLEDEWRPGCGLAGDEARGSAVWHLASFDQGRTWVGPTRVTGGSEAWRIFPAVSVSPGGVLDVSWMTTTGARDVDGHPALEQRYAYSLDGGRTWSESFLLRDAGDGGWDPALSFHQNGMVFLGDYNDIDSSWQAAHPVWPDTRAGHADVTTATVLRPWFADGWDPAKREAALETAQARPPR